MKRSAAYALVAHWLVGDEVSPPGPDVRWPLILEAASHHFVTPALAVKLAKAEGVPADVADYLEAVLLLNTARNAALVDGLTYALSMFASNGLSPLLLKGSSLLASGILPEVGYRMMGDLDILLPDLAELAAAEANLKQEGFVFLDDRFHGEHQLAMAIHPELQFGIELHRQLIDTPHLDFFDQAAVLARSEPVVVGGVPARVPCAVDRLLIAMAHAQLQDRFRDFGAVPLRLLQDIGIHRHQPDGEAAYAAAVSQALARDPDAFAPVADFVASAAKGPSIPAYLAAVLDFQLGRWRDGTWRLLRSWSDFSAKSGPEKLKSLSMARWQARWSRCFPRW